MTDPIAARGAQPGTEAGRELTDVDTIYVLMERVRKAVPKIEAEARQQGRERRDEAHALGFREGFQLAEARQQGRETLREAAQRYVDSTGIHYWRCENRTAERGWKEGEPPVIECVCGLDALHAALAVAPRPETKGTEP